MTDLKQHDYPASFEDAVELCRRLLDELANPVRECAARQELSMLQPISGLLHLGPLGHEISTTLRRAHEAKSPTERIDRLRDAWARAAQHLDRS